MRRVVLAGLFLFTGLAACARPAPMLIIATTTSVGNSGLLDTLSAAYERTAHVRIRTHVIGSGRALAMVGSGDADAAMTHAPAAEAVALRAHPEWRYAKIMFNDFVIAGPPEDAARAAGAAAAEAMKRIARSGERFISRGDQSGTHEREETLWSAAGERPAADRLVVAGAGMGATLRIASETGSYTLTDRATFSQHASALRLRILAEGDPALVNTYAVISSGDPTSRAHAFAEWLARGDGRAVIERFEVAPGIRAFRLWPRDRPRGSPFDLP